MHIRLLSFSNFLLLLFIRNYRLSQEFFSSIADKYRKLDSRLVTGSLIHGRYYARLCGLFGCNNLLLYPSQFIHQCMIHRVIWVFCCHGTACHLHSSAGVCLTNLPNTHFSYSLFRRVFCRLWLQVWNYFLNFNS